jgi:hypothetical protein
MSFYVVFKCFFFGFAGLVGALKGDSSVGVVVMMVMIYSFAGFYFIAKLSRWAAGGRQQQQQQQKKLALTDQKKNKFC